LRDGSCRLPLLVRHAIQVLRALAVVADEGRPGALDVRDEVVKFNFLEGKGLSGRCCMVQEEELPSKRVAHLTESFLEDFLKSSYIFCEFIRNSCS